MFKRPSTSGFCPDGPGILNSVSAYYHTGMRDVFVGSLCAIAVFLMSYHGYERKDDIAGDVACIFALGVALLPTIPEANVTPRDRTLGALHLLSAAGFFLTLAYFSLALFRKTDPTRPPTRRKRQRKAVYTFCGCTILVCVALILVAIFQAAAIVAFGVSWFTKGEAILKDQS